jgi:hypothetical protein
MKDDRVKEEAFCLNKESRQSGRPNITNLRTTPCFRHHANNLATPLKVLQLCYVPRGGRGNGIINFWDLALTISILRCFFLYFT